MSMSTRAFPFTSGRALQVLLSVLPRILLFHVGRQLLHLRRGLRRRRRLRLRLMLELLLHLVRGVRRTLELAPRYSELALAPLAPRAQRRHLAGTVTGGDAK